MRRFLLISAIAGSLLIGAVGNSYAKVPKFGKKYDRLAVNLQFTPEQKKCVGNSFLTMEKKTRKELFSYVNSEIKRIKKQLPTNMVITDEDKAISLERFMTAFLGLKVLTVGATKYNIWGPVSKSLKVTKISILNNCDTHFTTDLKPIFQQED